MRSRIYHISEEMVSVSSKEYCLSQNSVQVAPKRGITNIQPRPAAVEWNEIIHSNLQFVCHSGLERGTCFQLALTMLYSVGIVGAKWYLNWRNFHSQRDSSSIKYQVKTAQKRFSVSSVLAIAVWKLHIIYTFTWDYPTCFLSDINIFRQTCIYIFVCMICVAK